MKDNVTLDNDDMPTICDRCYVDFFNPEKLKECIECGQFLCAECFGPDKTVCILCDIKRWTGR